MISNQTLTSMKAFLTLVIISACFGIGARAQTAAPKIGELFKLKSFNNDSLWHLPKAPNTLNQLPLTKFDTPGVTLNNLLNMPDNAMLVYNTMPVKYLAGNDKMPVGRIGSVGDKMNKQVIVVNPLAEVPKP